MSSVPMPRDLSEEAVSMWLQIHGGSTYAGLARAVRALVSAKVREAVTATAFAIGLKSGETTDALVARVLGEEAPRG